MAITNILRLVMEASGQLANMLSTGTSTRSLKKGRYC